MKFIKTSFIPNSKLLIALVDKRITLNMEKSLKNIGIDVIKTCECTNTYNAIKFHPDINVCKLNDNNIVVAPNVYDYYVDVLNKYNFNVIKGDSYIEKKYPYNIAYNIALFGNYAVHNFRYTDKKILDFIERNNIQKIDVKQGYSKCSICIVDENSIITSDEGIFKSCSSYGIDCLFIQKGYIDLFDMDYGFIGGCSGLISNDTLAFYGNLSNHPNYNDIINFIHSKNMNIICLGDENLLDLGSIIPITCI